MQGKERLDGYGGARAHVKMKACPFFNASLLKISKLFVSYNGPSVAYTYTHSLHDHLVGHTRLNEIHGNKIRRERRRNLAGKFFLDLQI